MKRHTEQIEYGMKGSTNDQLRQTWLSTAVPLCEEHGLDGPGAQGRRRVRARLPVPVRVRRAEKRWLFDEGEISWDQVLERWKRRGPANEELVEQVQRGYRQMTEMAGMTVDEVHAALREVDDPEYPISIVDMGLVRGVEVDR